MEILPGIHRIDSDLGVRLMCQYLLVGEDRTILVDTGIAGTPEEVGVSLEDVDEVIISHADVDHCGGDRALKERHPSPWFSCGEPDRAYTETNQVMLAEIYRWSEPHGFGPDEDSSDWIRRELGGETMRLGPDRRIEILHLPGHAVGHLGIWDPRNNAAIIIDAALGTGIYDREGNRLIPPRYFDATQYQSTIRKLQTLRPERLLTAHHPPMRGEEALDFLSLSLHFTEQVHRVVNEGIREDRKSTRLNSSHANI